MRNRVVLVALTCVGAVGCLSTSDTSLTNCTPILVAGRDPALNPRLDIKFTDPLRIHSFGRNQMCSEVGADLSDLSVALARAGVVEIENSHIDRAAYEAMVQDAIRLGNDPGPDMLSWHTLWLAQDADVVAAITILSARPEVEYVYEVSNYNPPPPR